MRFRALLLAMSGLSACGGGEVVCALTQEPDGEGGCRCGDGYDPALDGTCIEADSRTHPTTGSSWTVLVYMAADNDLEPFWIDDIGEMMQVGNSTDFRIVAQADRSIDYVDTGVGGLGDFASTKRLEIQSGGVTQISDLGELNMGDPTTLSDFITWGVTTYPADRYALIFWNHGSAWPGFGSDMNSAFDLLTLNELNDALSDGLDGAGLPEFSLIGFDACLMATLETALTVRHYGEYMLASEELEPGHGWDYRVLSLAHDDPATAPDALASEIIDGFNAFAASSDTVANTTLSLVDLYRVQSLARRAFLMGQQAALAMSEVAVAVGKAQTDSLEFGRDPTGGFSANMIDLGAFASALGENAPDLGVYTAETLDALGNAVLQQMNGPATSAAQGLSIYFPPRDSAYATDYNNLAELAPWRDLLAAYYAAADTGAPAFINENHLADWEFVDGVLLVQGQLAAGDAAKVVSAEMEYGFIDGSDWVLLGTSTAFWNDAGLVTGGWDTAALVISQSATTAFGYLGLEITEDNLTVATIPFEYAPPPPGEAALAILTMVIDAEGNTVQETYYLLTDAGAGELEPEAGSSLFPLWLVIGATTQWERSSNDPLDPTAPLDLSLQLVADGTEVQVNLYAVNPQGEGDTVTFNGQI